MAGPTSECEFDPDHLYHDHREADELRAENERLRERKCFVCTDWMKQAERANAEAQRLRAALHQILNDPEALILNSHRDDACAALGNDKSATKQVLRDTLANVLKA